MAVSYSGIQLYKQCRAAFHKRYIAKEAAPDIPKGPALVRGLEIHQNIEDFLEGTVDDLHPDIGFYAGYFRTLKEHGCIPEQKFAFTSEWAPCEFDADEAMIRGIVDGVVLDGDTATVLEWKTGKVYAEHEQQRALYALAGFLLYPQVQEVEVINVYLDQRDNAKSRFPREDVEGMQWFWERQVNKTQPPQPYPEEPSWKCKWCDYRQEVGGSCKSR